MDYSALQTELITDPQGLGYAPLVAAGNDSGVAALLNTIGSGSAYLLTLAQIDKNDFLIATTTASVRLEVAGVGADGTTQLASPVIAKWKAVLQQARSADPGSQVNLTLLETLGSPVADNVMTADEFAALTTRQGSRAEVLFGAGTIVRSDDMAKALRGGA